MGKSTQRDSRGHHSRKRNSYKLFMSSGSLVERLAGLLKIVGATYDSLNLMDNSLLVEGVKNSLRLNRPKSILMADIDVGGNLIAAHTSLVIGWEKTGASSERFILYNVNDNSQLKEIFIVPLDPWGLLKILYYYDDTNQYSYRFFSTQVTPEGLGIETLIASYPKDDYCADTATITGRVVWDVFPVPNARVEVKDVGNYYTTPVLASAVAGFDGRFKIINAPVGDKAIYSVSPSNEYWGWAGRSIFISGPVMDVGDLHLYKKMQLLSPPNQAIIYTTNPTLAWNPFPGATGYYVYVYNDRTGSRVFFQWTDECTLIVSPSLEHGERYQWSVDAFGPSGPIAYWSAWFFTVW